MPCPRVARSTSDRLPEIVRVDAGRCAEGGRPNVPRDVLEVCTPQRRALIRAAPKSASSLLHCFESRSWGGARASLSPRTGQAGATRKSASTWPAWAFTADRSTAKCPSLWPSSDLGLISTWNSIAPLERPARCRVGAPSSTATFLPSFSARSLPARFQPCEPAKPARLRSSVTVLLEAARIQLEIQMLSLVPALGRVWRDK